MFGKKARLADFLGLRITEDKTFFLETFRLIEVRLGL
jgi:hypothetical protein